MIRQLRSPEKGCPWLSSKNFEDLIPYFFEELHEYQQAYFLNGPHSEERQQEIADLLFQTLLHITLLEETHAFNFNAVASLVVDKLRRRHPHVFDPHHTKYLTAEEAGKAWESLKLREAEEAGRSSELVELMSDKLERIPATLPSLHRASRIGEKTQGFGFDWNSVEEVFEKVKEEFVELSEAQSPDHRREELGDLLFSLAQYARHLGLSPEIVTQEANQKFLRRFRFMESLALKKGLQWNELSDEQKSILWGEAKIIEKMPT